MWCFFYPVTENVRINYDSLLLCTIFVNHKNAQSMKNLSFLILFITSFAFAQVQPYQIYNNKGKKISFEKWSKELSKADIVLFGEFHDNSIIHWLQLKLTKSLDEKRPIILGAEMFERDNAHHLNQYIAGSLDSKSFDTLVRFWNNYKTDYKPLVEYAKAHNIPFIATNVPRKYASKLYKEGMEALLHLPDEEKKHIAPLPFPYDATLPQYVKMMEMFKDSDHANENFPKAQAIKDATMAYSIIENYKKNALFLHFNGSYHSDYHEGISWYINQYQPGLEIKTISVVQQKDIHRLDKEDRKRGNFIIVVDEEMIKTF